MTTVALPVCDGMTLFEYGTAVEALAFAWRDLPELGYDVRTCGPPGGVRSLGGAVVQPEHGLDAIAEADIVILTGVTDPTWDSNPEWIDPLQYAASHGSRMVSICTGAFGLAAAGLLDGRRATTHWRHSALLQQRFPRIRVTPSELFVRDGSVLTGAGSAAGIDLCLQLIREDHGAGLANEVARRLVAVPHREGDQSQFVNTDTLRMATPYTFSAYLDRLSHNLTKKHDVDSMAHQARVSRRTLHRRFRQYTGVPPLEWLTRQRVFKTMSLLESTDRDVGSICELVGFDAPETLRYHFKQQTGLSPTAYRNRFRAAA
ncbi:GlxA family transcriptional regulator [Kocuria marina]|uniref:GlxA family transcriptional regulator n=1 Tax=Kocuria marina TaxID=223184 RepID=UPI0022DF1593|nr:helix-turn-helix domain-containing protein [Kocuria marina]